MKLMLPKLILALSLAGNQAFASDVAATVTQTFDKATHSLSLTGKSESAVPGTGLSDGEYLETSKTSLAEVELGNRTIARLGPGTVFQYSASNHEAELHSGTILFSKPKDGKELTIKISNVTAAVTGTTGFVAKATNGVVFGVIEGSVNVTVGTVKGVIRAGKMLVAVTGSGPQIVSYDVPDFVKTSAFFHRFQGQLPNEKAVEHEIAVYNDLVLRGFIEPVKAVLPTANGRESVAANNGISHEAAGNSVSAANPAGTSMASAGNLGNSSSLSLASGSTVSGGTLSVASSGASSFSGGTISGAGFTKTGSGTLTLSGANTYAGGVTVAAGVLGTSTITAPQHLGASQVWTVANGTPPTLGAATGSGGVVTIPTGSVLVLGSSGGGTLTLGSANFNPIGFVPPNGSSSLNLGGTSTLGGASNLSGTLTPGSTITNNTGNPITIGGITIAPHSSVTVPNG